MIEMVRYLVAALLLAMWSSSAYTAAIDCTSNGNGIGGQTASQDNQIFQNMTISVSGGQPGINTNGKVHVIVRNVKIYHANGSVGILQQGAGGAEIHNVNIIGYSNAGANIACRNASGIWITDAKLDGGQRGIELNYCNTSTMQMIEGSNQTGDLAGGHGAFVQWLNSSGGTLMDFYNFRTTGGTGGDVVNGWHSSGIKVTNGLIDGVYGNVACGVQDDENTSNMTVTGVTVFNAVDGAFCAYGSGGTKATFTNIKASTNVCSPAPSSGVGYLFVGSCSLQGCKAKTGIAFSKGTYAKWKSCTGSADGPSYNLPAFKPTQGSVAYSPHIKANVCQ